MGLKDLFRRWRSAPRVDFGDWEDEALLDHWRQRGQLTAEARALLASELGRRGLGPSRPDAAPDEPPPDADDEAEAADEDGEPDASPEGAGPPNLVVVVSSRAALLRESDDQHLLVVFPPRDGLEEPALPRPPLPAGERIAHVLVLDPLGRGWLPTGADVREAGLTARDVWRFQAPAAAPPPRHEGELGGRALPERLALADLQLRRAAGGSAVRAVWSAVPLIALLGPRVTPADLSGTPHASLVLGGIEPVTAADGERWVGSLDVAAVAALRQVVLLGGARDVDAAQAREYLPALGVDVHVVEPAAAPGLAGSAEALQRAALAGDAAQVAALEPTVSDDALEQLFVVNVIAERPDLVERVAALRCARDSGSGRAWFLRGALATFGADPALALDHYRRAAAAERPEPRAWANLAAVQAELGDDDAALATVTEGLAHLPGDEFLQTTRVLVTLRRKGAAAAREALAGLAATLPPDTVRGLEATIADPPGELLERPAVRRRWPHIALAACQAAAGFAHAGDLPQAERVLRRALALDRLSDSLVPATVLVGTALAQAGEHERALALYEAVQAELPAVPLLRFHRGNALLSLGRAEEAAVELRSCVDVAEGWDEPRVRLVTALTTLDRLDEADAELDVLEQRGVDPALVMSLDDEIERRREAAGGGSDES